MTLAFYLTGKERSSVVAVKVQKVRRIFDLELKIRLKSSFRTSRTNTFMIIFSFNWIDHGEVEI
jgi:hypothetical protein